MVRGQPGLPGCGVGELEQGHRPHAVRVGLDHLDVVRVVHHPEHVAERVDHRGGHEARAARRDRLVLRGAQRQQPVDGALEVVDVPVHDRAAGLARRAGRRVAAVDDAELVGRVADPELDVRRDAVRAGPGEVRLDAEELGVPGGGGRHVVGPEVEGGESTQAHRSGPHFRWCCLRRYRLLWNVWFLNACQTEGMLDTSVRLLRLLSLLQSRREWSGAELAERLEVTTRTVRNDVERLRLLGYAVQSRTGIAGGYRLGPGSAMPPLLLDDDEAVAVGLGLSAAAAGTVTGIEETSLRAITKLEQTLPARLRPRLDALRQATVSAAGGGPTVDADVLVTLATRLPGRTAAALRLRRPRRRGRASAGSSRTAWSTPGTAGTCWPGTATGRTGGRSGPTGSSRGCRPARGSPHGSRPRTPLGTSSAVPRPRRGAIRPGSGCTRPRRRSPTGSRPPGACSPRSTSTRCLLETGGDSLLDLVAT